MPATFFNTFSVPGYDYITIYPDSNSPYKFYYFNSRPRLGKQKIDNKDLPNLRFTFYRNPMDEAQVQQAILLLTTDLGLTSQEESAVRNGILAHINSSDYQTEMKLYYPDAYKRMEQDKKAGVFDKNKSGFTLGAVQATDGKAMVELWQGFDANHFVKYISPEHKPNLNGNFSTSFMASLQDLAAESMLNSLKGGYKTIDGKLIKIDSNIHYELTVPLMVPSIEATVNVTYDTVYESLMQALKIPYTKVRRKEKMVSRPTSAFSTAFTAKTINNTLNKIAAEKDKGVDITLVDYSAIAGIQQDEISNKILNALTDSVCGTLLSKIFTLNPVSGNQKDSEQTYSILDDIPELDDIHFTLSKKQFINMSLPANCSMFAQVPAEYEDDLINVVDLGSLSVARAEAQITCQENLNPEQIDAIEVMCQYDQKDSLFKNSQSGGPTPFLFKKDGDVKYFRYYVAKDASGNFHWNFKYKTRIQFIGRPASEWSEWRDDGFGDLNITYENIGFLNVNCHIDDVDWDVVKSVFVDISYPAAKDKNDTSKKIVLSQEKPSEKWGCYKYGHTSDEYQYSVRYLDIDGSEYPRDPKVITTANNDLSIRDAYSGQSMKGTFRVNYNNTQGAKVILDVYYRDEAKGIDKKETHSFQDGAWEWEWKMRVQEGAVEKIRYVYQVFYGDGSASDRQEFYATGRNLDIPMFTVPYRLVQPKPEIQEKENTLMIVGEGLFMNDKWAYAMVEVKYEDPENNIYFNEPKFLTRDKKNETVSVKCPANAVKPFICSATLVDTNGTPTPVPETACSNFFNVMPPTV